MKKVILFSLFLMYGLISKADQLAWITQEQAKTATAYLKKEKSIILWCACCDNVKKTKVTITSVRYEKVKDLDYYQVVLEGVSSSGKKIKEYLDLAYVHVNVNGKAKCLGTVLNFECDPCTKPFAW